MPVIEHKISINRSVTDVFKFLVDFSNNPKWQPDSIQLERNGHIKLGDMIVGTRRLMGRRVHVNADVVDYSPNQTIAFTGIMGSYPFRTTYKFYFGGGGTELTEIMDIRIPWIYFWVRPFLLPAIERQIRTSLENLKEYMNAHKDRA